jgi:hypothetical protein
MMRQCRSWIAIALAALPSVAHGFADATQFFANPALPHSATLGASAEGLYFTGAPRVSSLACQSCHVGTPGVVGLRLNADDPSLFTSGYQPGTGYTLQIELTHEIQGLQYDTPDHHCTDVGAQTYVQCNNNGFALEIDAAGGALAKSFVADSSTLLAPDGDAVFSGRQYDATDPKSILNNGATAWTFRWTAPPAGTGTLAVYVGAVDGNGGSGTVANDQDPYGDDTVQAIFFVSEAGGPLASAGCAVTPGCAAAPTGMLPLPLLLMLRRRRR